MNLYDYIVLTGLAVAVICAFIFIIRGKTRGKSRCGDCAQRAACGKKINNDVKKG